MTRRKEIEEDIQPLDPACSSHDFDLSDTFLIDLDGSSGANSQPFKSDYPLKTCADDPNTDIQLNHDQDTLSREKFLSEQNKDPNITQLSKRALPPEEAVKVGECFYIKDGMLMRKWRQPDEPPEEVCQVVHQIVVPVRYRREVMSLAHDTPMAGHL
jgi:hypothetical protein